MLDARVAPVDQVLTKTIDGEMIVLNLSCGHYYRLSPTASRIWELMKDAPTVAAIRDALVAQYDAPEATIEQDLLGVLDFLEEEKLIRVDRNI